MKIGAFEFSPALWPTLATLVLLPLLVGLGMWQLERAAWKQALVDTHEESTLQAAVPVRSLLASGEEQQYRPVAALGIYDLDHQLLLDNRTFQGHAGYHVLTPLRLLDYDEVVLVNRGWVPLGRDRAVLPELPGPEDEVVVNAIVRLPPEKFFRLGMAEEAHAGWPKVVQELDMDRLEQRLGYALLPVILLLDQDDAYGFSRDWKAVYGVTPDKHSAYAMQWFTLALVLLLIYIGVNTRRITNTIQVDDSGNE